jgi:dipeptidyl aminopeptidase/acylaminoacyl peptidase
MFRTRFKNEIVAEFLPPERAGKKQKLIVLCDGMPSVPRKQPLMAFLASQGYWVIYPRYRGAWESGGRFMQQSPHQDILDVVSELPKGLRDAAFGRRFSPRPSEIFVIGGSFGGAAAILASLDPAIKKVVANCPVVDWSILPREQKLETSNPSYAAYIREAFGNGYRLTQKNWNKLLTGRFFNPAHHAREITPSKVMMFHAKDDPYIPWQIVERFAAQTGVRLDLLPRGGHAKTELIVRKHWRKIQAFFARRDRKTNLHHGDTDTRHGDTETRGAGNLGTGNIECTSWSVMACENQR